MVYMYYGALFVVQSLSYVPIFVTPIQAPPSMEFSSQEYWSRLPCPPPGDLPDSGIQPTSLMSPALAGRLFTTSSTWEARGAESPVMFKFRCLNFPDPT